VAEAYCVATRTACYASDPNRRGHYAMLLSDVCLSVAYIGPKSRTESPRKTKIGTEVAHITRDSDTTFKVKRSNVKVTRPLYSPPCWRVRQLQQWACWPWETAATLSSAGPREALWRPQGEERGGTYRGGRPPTACLHCYHELSKCSPHCCSYMYWRRSVVICGGWTGSVRSSHQTVSD